jgi:hypothetical protein
MDVTDSDNAEQLLRANDICNIPRKKTKGLLNVSRAHWFSGVKEGKYSFMPDS